MVFHLVCMTLDTQQCSTSFRISGAPIVGETHVNVTSAAPDVNTRPTDLVPYLFTCEHLHNMQCTVSKSNVPCIHLQYGQGCMHQHKTELRWGNEGQGQPICAAAAGVDATVNVAAASFRAALT